MLLKKGNILTRVDNKEDVKSLNLIGYVEVEEKSVRQSKKGENSKKGESVEDKEVKSKKDKPKKGEESE